MESEGDRSPRQHVVDPRLEDTIDIEMLALQRLLDSKWMARIQTITPKEFGQLTTVEQRTWLARAERIEKRFGEQANMMRRNVRGPELQLPDALRAISAA